MRGDRVGRRKDLLLEFLKVRFSIEVFVVILY